MYAIIYACHCVCRAAAQRPGRLYRHHVHAVRPIRADGLLLTPGERLVSPARSKQTTQIYACDMKITHYRVVLPAQDAEYYKFICLYILLLLFMYVHTRVHVYDVHVTFALSLCP